MQHFLLIGSGTSKPRAFLHTQGNERPSIWGGSLFKFADDFFTSIYNLLAQFNDCLLLTPDLLIAKRRRYQSISAKVFIVTFVV